MDRRHDPMSRRAFMLATASAAILAGCASKPDDSTSPKVTVPTVASLLGAQAVPIRSLTASDPGIAALAKRLSQSKFVGLGEATQGSHEDALLKSLLIQTMIEFHDLRVVMLPASRAGMDLLDGYASGVPSGMQAADIVRQAPMFRIYKTEVMADFLTWLRGWNAVNADRKVRIFSVDCMSSSRDAADALAALAAVDKPAADALSAGLAPILTAEAKAERHELMVASRLTPTQRADAEAACRKLETELTRVGLGLAAFNARRAWQGLNALEFAVKDAPPAPEFGDYISRGSLFMAENALGLARGECAVYWGHNASVMTGRPKGVPGPGGEAPIKYATPNGSFLRAKLGPDYVALTQEFTEATFLAVAAKPATPVNAPLTKIARRARVNTLNALLTKASPQTAWIDLANMPEHELISDWRKTPIKLERYFEIARELPDEADFDVYAPESLFDVVVIHSRLTSARML